MDGVLSSSPEAKMLPSARTAAKTSMVQAALGDVAVMSKHRDRLRQEAQAERNQHRRRLLELEIADLDNSIRMAQKFAQRRATR